MPSTAIQSVGFIGLGNIGRPMAERLADSAFDTQVYDVAEAATAPFRERGVAVAESPAAMAAACDYLGICVRDESEVEAVLLGEAGIMAAARPGLLIAVHATVTQSSLMDWAALAEKRRLALFDAPMTGGAQGASDGTLCYMLGASESLLESVRPVLDTSAGKIIHAGGVGSGIALKLCNNLITYAEFAAMSEATRLAKACGLNAEVLREVGQSNGVINEQMHRFVSGRDTLLKKASPEEMQAFFGAMGRLGVKDLDCAVATAAAHAVPLPMTAFVRERIEDVFVGKA